MNETAPPAAAPEPSYRRFETLAEYACAFDGLLARARREVWLFDVSLQRSFDQPARIDLLRAFLAGDRNARLRIVLHDAGTVPVHCPRLCGLLRQFSEAIGIHQTTAAARSAADPLLVVDALHALRRVHHSSSRSVLITDDAAAVRPLHERLAQIHEASEPAVAATVLGL
ncbi:MAG: hypothetical protein ACK515_20920 [bacterium]|jgi:hypothetical protein|nr:hypothetical protein [Betaproteobacteria bacterium]